MNRHATAQGPEVTTEPLRSADWFSAESAIHAVSPSRALAGRAPKGVAQRFTPTLENIRISIDGDTSRPADICRAGGAGTIVERVLRVTTRQDPDVSEEVRATLEHEGITVRAGADCVSLAQHENGIAISADCVVESAAIVGSHVLIVVARSPNTDALDLGAL